MIAPERLVSLYDRINDNCKQPRSTINLLLTMTALADNHGRVGPYLPYGDNMLTVREVLGLLFQMRGTFKNRTEKTRESAEVEITREIQEKEEKVTPDELKAMVDARVSEKTLKGSMDNVSRLISELEKANLVTKHYIGFATPNDCRGAQRTAVYTLKEEALEAFRSSPALSQLQMPLPSHPN